MGLTGASHAHDTEPDVRAGHYAPSGTIGASAAEAATAWPPLRLPSLDGHLVPLTAPARIYVCGITPYDVTHLGHAATFVWADALSRVLRLVDLPVELARNVTDVDDVLTDAAQRQGSDYAAFGLIQEHQFDQDMKALSVRAPSYVPRARHHVEHVVRLAATLVALDRAYVRDGSVYFRGAEVAASCGLTREDALERLGEFGDEPGDPARDDPFDVPLWRRSDHHHPAWPSPWGPGRPGWHAECSAMALATLGGLVDVLVGGADLSFPHRAYQAGIAAAATGGRFHRATMPVGAVLRGGQKMAKSTGNLVLVGDLLREFPPSVIRLMLLDRPWRQQWEFTEADLEAAARRLDALYAAAGTPAARQPAPMGTPTPVSPAASAVVDALVTDLDVPSALSIALTEGGEAARLLIRTLALD